MKNYILPILGIIVVLGLLALFGKLISGVFALFTGAINAILGIILIAATLLFIAWMFRYAGKHRK